jgi:hypothetical protein
VFEVDYLQAAPSDELSEHDGRIIVIVVRMNILPPQDIINETEEAICIDRSDNKICGRSHQFLDAAQEQPRVLQMFNDLASNDHIELVLANCRIGKYLNVIDVRFREPQFPKSLHAGRIRIHPHEKRGNFINLRMQENANFDSLLCPRPVSATQVQDSFASTLVDNVSDAIG